MTKKRAIEIVVANVKMGWAINRWSHAVVDDINCEIRFNITPLFREPTYLGGDGKGCCVWAIPYQWLKDKHHL